MALPKLAGMTKGQLQSFERKTRKSVVKLEKKYKTGLGAIAQSRKGQGVPSSVIKKAKMLQTSLLRVQTRRANIGFGGLVKGAPRVGGGGGGGGK